MSQNSEDFDFDFNFDSDTEIYDPLNDLSFQDADEILSNNSAINKNESSADKKATEKKEVPAHERIDKLFESMTPRRQNLLRILSFCKEPRSVDEVEKQVAEIKKYDYSIYSAANFCSLLEGAGALERVNADGISIKELKQEPEHVFIDETEFLKPRKAPEVFWLSTSCGIKKLEENHPFERLQKMLADETKYLPIYKRILELCAEQDGAKTADIAAAVDPDPLLESPRLYASRFTSRLEKCEAIEWKNTWITTDVGRKGLTEILTDKSDDDQSTEDGK